MNNDIKQKNDYIITQKKYKEELQKQFNEVTNSKFYKLWQKFNYYKNSFKEIFQFFVSNKKKYIRVIQHLKIKFYSIKRNIIFNNIYRNENVHLAIIIHCFYLDVLQVILDKLKKIPLNFDLFITINSKNKDIEIKKINRYHKKTNIYIIPNHGRDILPFYLLINSIIKNKYSYILKLHTKKSPHLKNGNEWMNEILEELLPNRFDQLFEKLNDSKTGIIGPKKQLVSLLYYHGGYDENKKTTNLEILEDLVLKKIYSEKKIDWMIENLDRLPFFAGTMFWSRTDLFKPLIGINLTPNNFELEEGQFDATLAHALERFFGKIIHIKKNKKMWAINKKGKITQVKNKSFKQPYKYVYY